MPARHPAVTRAEDGTVQITEPIAGPAFTRAVLDVAGAVLTWPVLGPTGLPAAEIHDVAQAQQWLWAVYGERTAAAVDAVASGAPEAAAEPMAPEQPTALAESAARLAFGHWTARWWPASHLDGIPALEPGALGLELAALTHECQQLLDEAGEVEGRELLEEHLAALAPLVRWWQSGASPRRLGGVLRLIDDAADGLGLGGEEIGRLRSALEQDDGPSGTPLDLADLFVRQGEFALAAGSARPATGRVIARGVGTNNWCRYPPGFVDAAEDAVTWTVYALGAGRWIEVEVVAGGTAPVGGGRLAAEVSVERVHLAAEVHVDGGPPSRVPLARRDDVWTGRANLDIRASTTPSVEVGVLLPGFDPGPGADDRAAREAVRALARRRLGEAAAPHDGEAAQSGPFLAEILAAAAVEEDF
ncbi:hypothetical protein [Streptomyces griseorubiginosus]|uniref:Uncharacterized protein n=1 Tax=Streptomyces griseorubiginosus TaxID=67304 RepID=A0A101RWT0_9ACTN|nr:hypothetical protein [Streptomyces griseorubiginosus]KUN63154.1 hypothetical protein AQJ54_29745 [Streptomyces griseorubiginosus]